MHVDAQDYGARHRGSIHRRRLLNTCSLALAEGLAVFISLLIGDWLLFQINHIPVNMKPGLLFIPAWWGIALFARLYPGWGLGAVEELRRILLGLTGTFALAAFALLLLKNRETSRITYVSAYILTMVLLPMARSWMKTFCIRRGMWGVPAAIYGEDETVPRVVSILESEPGMGYVPSCIFDSQTENGKTIAGIPVVGNLEDTCDYAGVAIAAMPQSSRHELIEMLEGPLASYPTVILIPDLYEAPSLWVKPRDLQGVLGLEISHTLLDPLPRLVKVGLDFSSVLITSVIWGPLVLLLAALIRLQDGHFPFFIQERIGLHGKVFKVLKFRTMRPNAEAYLEQALQKNPQLREEWETHFKLKKDPRITPIGRFLRVTSLDELPQLCNVLMGQMALVGPRPLPPYHNEKLPERVRKMRDRVRPGITGMWQVSGRSDAGLVGMETWDAYYVRNWSVWLDIVILVRTVRVVSHGQGAY